MALRDQPYFPLYVQDYLTDEKLNNCSAATQGVYIKILCIFHKSEPYGGILFKQKDKQNESMCLNFAFKFAKLLPFSADVILPAVEELIEEGILIYENDFLYQKRMCKDFQLSLARSKAAKKGGGNPNLFKQHAKNLFKQKDKQNPEYEYENEYEVENDNTGGVGENKKKICEKEISEIEINKTIEYCHFTMQRLYTANRIRELWEAFTIQNEKEFYLNRQAKIKHFQNFIKFQRKDGSEKSNITATTAKQQQYEQLSDIYSEINKIAGNG